MIEHPKVSAFKTWPGLLFRPLPPWPKGHSRCLASATSEACKGLPVQAGSTMENRVWYIVISNEHGKRYILWHSIPWYKYKVQSTQGSTLWFYGPRPGAFLKLQFVGSLCLHVLLVGPPRIRLSFFEESGLPVPVSMMQEDHHADGRLHYKPTWSQGSKYVGINGHHPKKPKKTEHTKTTPPPGAEDRLHSSLGGHRCRHLHGRKNQAAASLGGYLSKNYWGYRLV